MRPLIAMLLVVCCGCNAASASDSAAQSVLTASPSDRVTIEQRRDTNGSYRVAINGERYDGRKLIKALIALLGGFEAGGWLRDADIAIDVAVLSGFDGAEFHEVSLRLATSSGRVRLFTAKTEGDVRLVGVLSDTSGGQTITLKADDAGSLLRAVGLYGRVSGGHLSLTLNLPTDGAQPPAGRVMLLDFDVVNEPLFADMQRWKGNGETHFTQMQLNIRLPPGHFAIDRGFACGATVDTEIRGIVDLSKGKLDIDGHLLLAFGNQLLSESWKEELAGISMFVNYHSRGAIDAPHVQINHSIPLVLSRELLRSCSGLPPRQPG